MKINEFINESTTAGAIATVAAPMTTQSRNASIYGGKKVGNLLTGKKTNKKYANSVNEATDDPKVKYVKYSGGKKEGGYYTVVVGQTHSGEFETRAEAEKHLKSKNKKSVTESKMKQVAMDLKDMDNGNFQKKYGKSKEQMKFLLGDPEAKKTVHEADLQEDDLILVPGQGHRLKTGFHAFDPDKADHEGETLKNSLRTIVRNAKELHDRLENQDQFPEWVSEKIGTIKGMMTAVTEYLISKQEPSESAGVIAAGGVGEGLEHGDHEISMAKSEMRSAAKSAKRIYDMLNQRDELMAWQQSYITLASDYLDSVADSMEEEAHSGRGE